MSSITTKVTTTVTVGEDGYYSPLIITAAGTIAPTTLGADGIDSALPVASVSNYGSVTAADGGGALDSDTTYGGTGVHLYAGTLNNAGVIGGGSGHGAGEVSSGPFHYYYGAGAGGSGATLGDGTVTNTGIITGGGGGGTNVESLGGPAAIAENGAKGGDGVYLGTGTLTNTNGGFIMGGQGGTGTASYNNGSGRVHVGAAGSGGDGVFLQNGTLTNTNSSFIEGGQGGSGNVRGAFGGDGALVEFGTLTNTNGAFIIGGDGGGSTDRAGAGGVGVAMDGGTLTNSAGAFIEGGNGRYGNDIGGSGGFGVFLQDGALTNSATIKGGDAGGGGTQSGIGGAGVYLGNATLTNTGVITGGAGGSGFGAPGTGGDGVILNGGTLTTSGTISGGQGGYGGTAGDAVLFQAPSTMVVDDGAIFNGAIGGFKFGDTVDITNLSPTEVMSEFNAITDTLTASGDGTLQFAGTSGDTFLFTSDGRGGTDVTVACFRRGTRILGASGEVAIESLRIGDLVITRSGGAQPIRWIGRRRYSVDAAAGNRDVLPIRIRASALADGLPRRDLWVSPEHAMFLDGMLIPALLLVNGTSIVQEETIDELQYFHLEFDAHAVIYAEGALAESFVDDDSRAMFDNDVEYAQLYPSAVREPARFCAPRTEEGEVLEVVRRRLAARAATVQIKSVRGSPWFGHLDVVRRDRIDGWAKDEAHPERPLELRILDNGIPIAKVCAGTYRKDLHNAGVGEGRHGFSFSVPGGLAPDVRHLIEVRRADDGRALHGSPFVLNETRPARGYQHRSAPRGTSDNASAPPG